MNVQVENKGRNPEIKQLIFDNWNEHSIVTVDRRNSHDQVKISKSRFLSQYDQIKFPDDIEFEYLIQRCKEMVAVTRHVATKTLREIRQIIFGKFGYHISIGTVVVSKPFYITNSY